MEVSQERMKTLKDKDIWECFGQLTWPNPSTSNDGNLKENNTNSKQNLRKPKLFELL